MGGTAGAGGLRPRPATTDRGGSGNSLNRSRISTMVCVPLASNLAWADAPGNTVLPATVTGLPKRLGRQLVADRRARPAHAGRARPTDRGPAVSAIFCIDEGVIVIRVLRRREAYR